MRAVKFSALAALMVLCALAAPAQTTTVTGIIKDLTGTAVTSGYVTFTLQPSVDTTISGSARYTPQTVTCNLTGTGAIKATDNVSACVVTNNTALTPNGTNYLVTICAYNACSSQFNWFAIGGTQDITQVVPTPTTAPAYTFVDTLSNQTIAGNKTFTGTLSASQLGAVVYADVQGGSNMGAKIVAAAGVLTSGGVIDARNFHGVQGWASNVVGSLASGTVLLLSCDVEIDTTSIQTISVGHISIESGCQNPWLGAGQAPQQSGARFKATALLSGPVFAIAGAPNGISGVSVGNITIDCNSNATWGFDVDTLMSSTWPGMHQVQNCTTGGMLARVTGTTADVGTQRNSFGNWGFQNVPIPILLEGNDESGGPNNANTNNNSWGQISASYTGEAAFECHAADSNTFDHWTTNRISGVGYGADFGGASSQDCKDNHFLTADFGPGSSIQRTGNNGFNRISHYILENGANPPTVVGTGRIVAHDGNGHDIVSFVGGSFYPNSANQIMRAPDVKDCYNATFTSNGLSATCGNDWITHNSSSGYMNYFAGVGHQFFGGYVANFSTTGSSQTITSAQNSTDQAFNCYAVNGVNKWCTGKQLNNHYIINDATVAGGLTSLDIAQGTGAITMPGTLSIGNAGAGGVITNSAATTAAGSGQLLILFTTTSTAAITSGQTGVTAGVCVVNTSYNGTYGLTVLNATQYYIAATGSEPTGCGVNTPGTTTLSTTSATPLTMPGLKSNSGTRYACFDTAGHLVSSASACSGT